MFTNKFVNYFFKFLSFKNKLSSGFLKKEKPLVNFNFLAFKLKNTALLQANSFLINFKKSHDSFDFIFLNNLFFNKRNSFVENATHPYYYSKNKKILDVGFVRYHFLKPKFFNFSKKSLLMFRKIRKIYKQRGALKLRFFVFKKREKRLAHLRQFYFIDKKTRKTVFDRHCRINKKVKEPIPDFDVAYSHFNKSASFAFDSVGLRRYSLDKKSVIGENKQLINNTFYSFFNSGLIDQRSYFAVNSSVSSLKKKFFRIKKLKNFFSNTRTIKKALPKKNKHKIVYFNKFNKTVISPILAQRCLERRMGVGRLSCGMPSNLVYRVNSFSR